MSATTQLMVFRLAGQRYAVALAAVQRVVAAVEITPLPGAPDVVAGVINVAGELVPVFCLRRRFHLPEREVGLLDQFVIARSADRTVAFIVDEAQAVMAHPASDIVAATRLVPQSDQIQGVIKLPDGLVLIHDLEKFLSAAETEALAAALHPEVSHAR